MFSRASRIAFVAALASVAIVGGCDCGDGGGGGGAGDATLVARFPGGQTVQADGSSRLKISLTALDADGNADTATVTVESDAGFVAAVDGDFAGTTVGLEPNDQGVAEFDFSCEPNFEGRVRITADNGNAKTSFNLTCVAPQGDIVITVDDTDCASLQADGISSCPLHVTVVQQAAISIPQTGALTVSVTATDPSEANGGDNSVILVGGVTSDQITINLDNNGQADIEIRAPDIAETVTLSYNFGNTTVDRDLKIDAFQNQASVAINGNTDVVGGDTVTVTVTVIGADGATPIAPNDRVDISVSGAATVSVAGGAAAAAVTDVALVNGAITADIATPTVAVETVFTVTVSYRFLPAFDPLVKTFAITATEPGALLLNLALDKTAVRSDIAAERAAKLTVTFTEEGAAVVGGVVVLSLSSADAARVAFIPAANSGDTASQVTLAGADFDSAGVAEVDVTALPNVAPGLVLISARGDDNDPTTATKFKEQELSVNRDPILQSIVALPVDPGVLGVRGSVLASSTVVKFQLFDDRNEPLPNVPVTFAANATADRGVTVGGSDISDADGFVQTVLAAGTIAGPVSVEVTARPVSPDPQVILAPLTVRSQTIAIVGGLPNFLSGFMACSNAIERVEGTPFSCTATLVDRFSNVVGDQQVQFRAEGSGTNAVATSDAEGVAGATLVLDDGDTASTGSVSGWSYGFIPSASDAVDFPGCFDDTIATPCSLLELCGVDLGNGLTAADPDFCPLPIGCLADAQAAVLDMFAGASARDADINTYVGNHRSCGFPVSCLLGDPAFAGGVDDLPGDDCAVALGCMDYSLATECPADGVMTVIASTRGEESFSDGNGNGVLDFNDVNGNGRMDGADTLTTRAERCLQNRCELANTACANDAQCAGSVALDSFVDLPEPFLDKNDSCSRDDLTNVPALALFPSQKVKHTDLFNDVDGNRLFGFTQNNQLLEKNGVYDPDTETFLEAHLLTVGAPLFRRGLACDSTAANKPATCLENLTPAGIVGIDIATIPATLAANGSIDIVYRWADGFGNCPSPGFEGASVAGSTGPLQISGDTNLLLSDANCGFLPDANPMFPYCEELPRMAAPSGVLHVEADCADEIAPSLAKITWSLGDELQSVSINVLCGL